MCQLSGVHFAAQDPSAGSTIFLMANDFMRAFPCAVHKPQDHLLEAVVVTLITEYRQRNGHHRWREQWSLYQPRATTVGEELAASGAYAQWQASGICAGELYHEIAARLVA